MRKRYAILFVVGRSVICERRSTRPSAERLFLSKCSVHRRGGLGANRRHYHSQIATLSRVYARLWTSTTARVQTWTPETRRGRSTVHVWNRDIETTLFGKAVDK